MLVPREDPITEKTHIASRLRSGALKARNRADESVQMVENTNFKVIIPRDDLSSGKPILQALSRCGAPRSAPPGALKIVQMVKNYFCTKFKILVT